MAAGRDVTRRNAAVYRRWLYEDGFSVGMATEISALADPSIHELSLIIPIFTMSGIEKDEVANLIKAVEGGVGLAGHHGGMSDAFHGAVDYQFMVGGQWVTHPSNIIDYTVDMIDPGDSVMGGGESGHSPICPSNITWDSSDHVLASTTFS